MLAFNIQKALFYMNVYKSEFITTSPIKNPLFHIDIIYLFWTKHHLYIVYEIGKKLPIYFYNSHVDDIWHIIYKRNVCI